METIMLAIKFVLFYGMELLLFAIVGLALFAGLYQMIRDKVQARRAPARPVAPEIVRK